MRLNWGCEMVRDRSDGYRPHVSNSVGSQRPSRPPGREGRSGSISTISSDPRTPCVARNHARPAHRLCIPIVFAHGRWRSGQQMLATWPASARRGPLPRAASTRGRSVATREPITAGAKGRCCHSCASPPPQENRPYPSWGQLCITPSVHQMARSNAMPQDRREQLDSSEYFMEQAR